MGSSMVVHTVTGPIEPDVLGFTSMHEHVLTDNGPALRRRHQKAAGAGTSDSEIWDEPVSLETVGRLQWDPSGAKANLDLSDDQAMIGELRDFAKAGGGALVEVSAIGARVGPRRYATAAAAAGVHIVLATGFYTADFWPERYLGWSVERFAELMVAEIRDGVDGTGIRAGHIKCGVSTLSQPEERVLVAAALAAQETGASVTVHPGFGIGSDGRRIVRILIGAGMSADRIIMAHSDTFLGETDLRRLLLDPSSWPLSLDYHRELLDQGVILAFDAFGQNWSRPLGNFVGGDDWRRLAGVIALVRDGHGDKLVLGTDTFMPMLTRRGGGHGYHHLCANVIPQLRAVGISDWDIHQMTVATPRRLLSIPAERGAS